MAAKSQDKVLFGAASVLLLASLGWTVLQTSKLGALRESANTGLTPTPYTPAGIDAPKVSTQTWPVAPSQTRGAEWVYDVFTPPEIYYNAATKQFSVTPPSTAPVAAAPEVPFGVELVQVKQDVFRLQLVGYIGGEGDYRGTFENALTGETIIGRAGKKIPDLDLTIRSFEVKRNRTRSAESMDIITIEAVAVVLDNKTGETYSLSNKSRLIKGTPFALLKTDGASEPAPYKAGAKLTVGAATYTVLNVVAEPASVEITKESPDLKEPLTKTLTPGSPPEAVPAPSSPAPTPTPTPSSSPFPF